MHKLFAVYTEQVRAPYTELAASGLPNPTHLEGGGGGRGYDLTRLKTSRWFCFLTFFNALEYV